MVPAGKSDVRQGKAVAVSSEVDVVAHHGHTWIEVKAHRWAAACQNGSSYVTAQNLGSAHTSGMV